MVESTPTDTNIFTTIRQHAATVTSHSNDVRINSDKLQQFVNDLSVEDILATDTTKRLGPLSFDSVREKLNLVCILDSLEFGSGWRNELHAAVGRGASDTILFAIIGLHLSQRKLDAQWMSSCSIPEIAEAMNLTQHIHQFVPVDSEHPYITTQKETDLYPLAEHAVVLLNHVGNKMRNLQLVDWYDFVTAYVQPDAPQPTANKLVQSLLQTFPVAFDDSYRDVVDELPKVYVLKKACLLAYDLYIQFRTDVPACNFTDHTDLPVFADNVVPAALHHVGVLEYSTTLEDKINSKQEISKKHAAEIRCSSIVAVHRIVRGLQKKHPTTCTSELSEAKLDCFLWARFGKQPEVRAKERHIEKTPMY